MERALPSQLKPRRFPAGTVALTEQFLSTKLPELLPERGPIPPDQFTAFLTVNRDLRKKAEDTKRQLAARTQPRPLWEGAVIQPRNTKIYFNFAESRSYRYNGKEVDTAVQPIPAWWSSRRLCLRLQRGCGVRGWGCDGLGTGARGRGARARRALMLPSLLGTAAVVDMSVHAMNAIDSDAGSCCTRGVHP